MNKVISKLLFVKRVIKVHSQINILRKISRYTETSDIIIVVYGSVVG